MLKGSSYILWIVAGLLACLSFLFLTNESMATQFQMPDLKGQFKKQPASTNSQVQIQADQVSFSSADNKAHAKGNVVVSSKTQQLYCDELQLDRVVQQVVAEGNVYLDTPQETVIAQGLTYNFNDGTGEFRNARVFVDPYQIRGQSIDKFSENYMVMKEGYMTTCDLDEPHYRMGAHRMDIFQRDKAVVHGMKIYLGKVPIMYLPYYVQDLKNRPIFTFVPGDSKDFGLFLLTTARFQVGPHVKVNLHLDARERDGFSEGFDVKYDTPNFGSGLVSAYYTDENQIASHHLWDLYKNGVKIGPTTHHERYRIIWRHQWQIDKNTNAIWQIYKIHDYDIVNNGFLKEYFPKEYEQGEATDSYFLLTRNMPHGTLTFHIEDTRINRPLRGVEYYPQIDYTLNNQQVGKTGVYFKSTNDFSNISDQNYPKTVNNKTMRFDTDNDFSHPMKISFIQLNPHVGGEETYYSRTANLDQNNIFRGQFHSGADVTTKFYRVWNYHTNFMGLNINGLRHVITPTFSYVYMHRPTFNSAYLNQFDSIDARQKENTFALGLENELQTKRNGQVVDLIRALITTNYQFKGMAGHRGFGPYDSQLDFMPTDWLTIHNDNEYDFHAEHWNSENFDGVIHGKTWSYSLGSRFTRQEGDQITTELDYIINPKWKFRFYDAFPLVYATNGNTNSAREFDYVITRDLHEWEMDFAIDKTQGHGGTFYILFRLKASPGMKFDLVNTSYQESRPGAQTQ